MSPISKLRERAPKNTDAELKDDRPQCRDCGTRVEAKK
jgi:hypothetical protein